MMTDCQIKATVWGFAGQSKRNGTSEATQGQTIDASEVTDYFVVVMKLL